MKRSSKVFGILSMLLCVMMFGTLMTSCSDDDSDNSPSIVGRWVDGDETLTLGKDGSYRLDSTDGQYRVGTYSYNPSTSLMVINVKAVPGMNGAYQQTLIVQTLTSTTLVLMYTDGDVEGYYTRK